MVRAPASTRSGTPYVAATATSKGSHPEACESKIAVFMLSTSTGLRVKSTPVSVENRRVKGRRFSKQPSGYINANVTALLCESSRTLFNSLISSSARTRFETLDETDDPRIDKPAAVYLIISLLENIRIPHL